MRMKINVIYQSWRWLAGDCIDERMLSVIDRLVTFNPYCNFAIMGLSAKKVKSLRFQVKGIGMMRPRKTTISNTRRRKTWKIDVSAPSSGLSWSG
jgi:hypothetical protein